MTLITLNEMICGLGTQGCYTPPPPPRPFMFVCYLLKALSDHTLHKFGVAVRVRCSTKSSTSAQDGSLKNDSFAVHSDTCCSVGCTW